MVFGVSTALLAVGQLAHGQDGRPSKSVLQQMGLGGMSVMSDDDALAVRGLGFSPGMGSGSSALASGNSFATINTPFGSAHSENAYSSSGKHVAGGDNFSFAGFSATNSMGGKDDGHGSDCHNRPPSRCMSGKNHSPKNCGFSGMGGNKGGMGGKTTTSTFVVFAGGFSHAFAH
jgi:hypothetical protein